MNGSVNVLSCRSTTCDDHRSSLNTVGGLGGAVSPPSGPGQSPGGGPGGKAPGSSENLAVYKC